MNLREEAKIIIDNALMSAMPDNAVARAIGKMDLEGGRLVLIAIGKAGWSMAKAAYDNLGDRIDRGVVVTKYHHSMGEIAECIEICEAGHPVPDENSYSATRKAIEAVTGLSEEDKVLFLISGGGSALFEAPAVSEEEMADITKQLLASGADITEMNTIRKRLSMVKGGKFALTCAPAKVYTVILSDIIGDPLDMIASGPAYPDSTTREDAIAIINKYGLKLSDNAMELMNIETPKELSNVTSFVTGSVKELCESARKTAVSLGYEPIFLSASLNCEAREAGRFLASIVKDHMDTRIPLAFIAGGETVVHLTGNGLGGRNQELALSAAIELSGLENVLLFSVGSDGTDGPTDAAGGMVTGESLGKLKAAGIDANEILKNNDAYNALKAIDELVMTGPTGTNVNDLTVALIKV
ncbi:MAG: glycerate kinase [Eubacteriales bacterium]|nr:glycerate kinase [Eubacteriales bacterium]